MNKLFLIAFIFILGWLSSTEFEDMKQDQDKGNTSHKNASHVCADSTHFECDGLCECDGMECSDFLNKTD